MNRTADATLYVCLRVFTDGFSVNGIGKFDIGMKIFSLADATIQITKSREFNTGFYFNEKAERSQILFKPINHLER